MKKTLYILTRFIGKRNSDEDEFVREWFFSPGKEEAVFETEERQVVIIHGCVELVGHVPHDDKGARRLREIVSGHPGNGGQSGFICHARDYNIPLQPAFNGFAFASAYSIGASRGEWVIISKLIDVFSGHVKIRDAALFDSAFDKIWDCFTPDLARREGIQKQHRAFAAQGGELLPPIAETNQTEHYLLIWNAISGNWVARLLTDYLAGKHNKTVQVTLVTDREQFDTIAWSKNCVKEAVNAGRKKDEEVAKSKKNEQKNEHADRAKAEAEAWLKNWRKVFVLAELHWSEADFEGISIVFDILKKRGDGEDDILEILTCSVLERKALYDAVRDKHQLVVKSFPHLHLAESPDFSLLERMYVSARKWRYKRAELLDEREILASWLHSIKYLLPANPDFAEAAASFNKNLFSLRSLLNTETLAVANRLESLLEKKERFSIAEAEQCVQSLENALKKLLSERSGIAAADKRQARVMIVEDDFEYREKLQELFEPWFTEVIVHKSGTDALTDLKNDPYQYSALVVDLELLEDGFEDLVQGADLVDYCERSARWIAVRVVTGLSRNSIPKRISVSNDHIVLKLRNPAEGNNSPFILPHFDEEKFMEAFSKEIDRLVFHKNHTGPSKGKFARPENGRESPDLTSVYYERKTNNPEDFKENLGKTITKVEWFLRDSQSYPINTKFTRLSMNLASVWEPHLWDLLAHRLVSIFLQKRDGTVKYIDYQDESGLYFDLGFPKGKKPKEAMKSDLRGWFTTRLGFSITSSDISDELAKVKLGDNDGELFPHEIEWKKTVDVEDFTLLSYKFSPACCEDMASTMEEISGMIEPQRDEKGAFLIKDFSDSTSFSDFRIMLDFLTKHTFNQKVRSKVFELFEIIKSEYDSARDVFNIPKWLEEMIDP